MCVVSCVDAQKHCGCHGVKVVTLPSTVPSSLILQDEALSTGHGGTLKFIAPTSRLKFHPLPIMLSQNGINPHIVQVFVPPSVRLYSVSMTCDYDEGPVVGSQGKNHYFVTDSLQQTFRVNVAPKPREPRDNVTPSLRSPGNNTPCRLTEDLKDTTIVAMVSLSVVCFMS